MPAVLSLHCKIPSLDLAHDSISSIRHSPSPARNMTPRSPILHPALRIARHRRTSYTPLSAIRFGPAIRFGTATRRTSSRSPPCVRHRPSERSHARTGATESVCSYRLFHVCNFLSAIPFCKLLAPASPDKALHSTMCQRHRSGNHALPLYNRAKLGLIRLRAFYSISFHRREHHR